MPSVVLKRFEQILQSMVNATVARSDLSYMGDASSVKHMLAAVAREIDETYYQLGLIPDRFSIDTAVGADLDARAAEIQPALITRRPAAAATGTVVFSRPTTIGTVTIPIGTVVKTASGIEFTTTAIGTILNGNTTSGNVPVVANEEGSAGNVALGTVTKFNAKPAGITGVTNTTDFSNGIDEELDDAFRARLKEFISTLPRSTLGALEFYATQIQLASGQRVAFARAVEDPLSRGEVVLYVDDGAGTAETSTLISGENVTQGIAGLGGNSAIGGETFLTLDNKPLKPSAGYTITSPANLPHFAGRTLIEGTHFTLNDADGKLYFTPPLSAGERIFANYTAYTGLMAEVQKVIDGDPNDRLNYMGVRAAGVRVRVRTPTILQQIVEVNLALAEGYQQIEVAQQVSSAIQLYINNLGISGDIIRNEIIEKIMSVSGVYNCTLVQPATDIVILDDQLPRIVPANILIT
jgi:uncharacterized phage protein gp47/JayE